MNDLTPPQQYQEKMQTLRHTYLQRLKKSLRDVRRLRELLLKNLAPLKDLQEISRLAHNLTGSGATFGFPEISQSAAHLQQSLKILIDAHSLSKNSDKERREALKMLDVFYETSRIAIAVSQDLPSNTQPESTPACKANSKNNSGTIGVLSRKENIVTDEIQYFSKQGYQIVYVDNFHALQSIKDLCAAIISDDLSVSDEQYLSNLLLQGKEITLDVPFAFRLTKDDYKSRLQALRLGAKMCLTGDVNGKELNNAFLTLINRIPEKNPHIFVVTKDEMLAGLYKHILEQSGIKAHILTSNKDPLKIMSEENFDLVIADFDLPFSKGTEFIDIIRQTNGLLNLPIVFMCTASEYSFFEVPPNCTSFLLKPFTPEQMMKLIQYQLNKFL